MAACGSERVAGKQVGRKESNTKSVTFYVFLLCRMKIYPAVLARLMLKRYIEKIGIKKAGNR